MNTLFAKENSALRRWTGPLTSDLTLRPGDFGLGKVPERLLPDATTTAVCGFCSTGCGLKLHLREGRAVNITPDTGYPVNLGMACPKGWEALAPLGAADRATMPFLRDRESGELAPVDWDHALQVMTLRLKALMDQHGPESIAVLSTGQICTEEMALLGALFKFGMGGVHLDSNTRQCMATSHVAYKQSFGFDAPPYAYADFEASDVLVLFGSNLCIAHPILWQRVLRNGNGPEILVVDPRKTETAMAATQHLAIRPKADLVFLYGVARELIRRGAVDEDFVASNTAGFEEFARFVERFTPEMVCAAAGLAGEQFERFVGTIEKGERVSFWWTMGINQGHESTRTAQAIINLALMTGQIGRAGTGANSVTGQCNAMGSRLFSNATGLFGGRDFLDAGHRAEVAGLLGIAESKVPRVNSLAYDQIVHGITEGKIKGLWVIATNTAHSWIDQEAFQRARGQLEFLVVQDLYATTETARAADLVLPAAGWGEKEGTFINSERRFGLVKKVSRAPGQALADFSIFKLVAHYWGCGEMFREWTSPQAAFQILKRLSAGRPCDITGIEDYRMLEECGGVQWPWTEAQAREGMPAAERRLFEDGRFFHPDGRARFVFEDPREPAEVPDSQFPFVLLTGRGTSAQWHTQTRSGKSDVLRQLYPENIYVEINPNDARRLRIKPNSKVEISSRRGRVVAAACITPTVQPGQVFVPMHYPETNRLTQSSVDPYSRQPSYKYCAVQVRRVAGETGL